MRSFWLCKKAKRKRAFRHQIERPEGEPPHVEFEVFEPKADKEVHGGTVTRAKATCVCCGAVLPPERVRAQLAAQKGGADAVFDEKGSRTGGARMTAVVTLQPEQTGRHYRLPTDADYEAVRRSQVRLADILGAWESGAGSRGFARFRMSRCRRSVRWGSAYSATACSSGVTCSRRDRRWRWWS